MVALCLQGGGQAGPKGEVEEAVVAEAGGEGKVGEFTGSHASWSGLADPRHGGHACKLAGTWLAVAATLAPVTTASHLPAFFFRPTLSMWCLHGSVCAATWGSPHTVQM